MTERSRTLLLAAVFLASVGGAAAWSYGTYWRWPSRSADGLAQPLWLLEAYRAEAEDYLARLDREQLLRAFLISEAPGYGGEVVDSVSERTGDGPGLAPLRVLRGQALPRARSQAPLAVAPLGHDLANALASGREDAIALETEAYVGDVLASGAAVVIEDAFGAYGELPGGLLHLDDSRLRRVVRWIDPRREARAPLARAAARPGTLAESFAETVGAGGTSVARTDTAEVLGSVQWLPRIARALSDSVFQVSGSAQDWALADALYTRTPEATLDSLREIEALDDDALRGRLLPLVTYRLATRRMGRDRLRVLADAAPDDASDDAPLAVQAVATGPDAGPPPIRTTATALDTPEDTARFRLRTRRAAASLMHGDPTVLPWAVRLDTVLVVNVSGLRPAELRAGSGVYGPSRWVGPRHPSLDALAGDYDRVVLLVGPGARADSLRDVLDALRRRGAPQTVAAVVIGPRACADLVAEAGIGPVVYQPSADLIDWRNAYAAVFGGHALNGGPGRTRVAPLDPFTVDIDVVQLTDIDVAMREAVKAGAFPGAQVSVVYGGHVVYDKAFGTLAPGERGVRTDDLYDLASLTKVTSTTLAVMRLYERGELELDAPLRLYLEGLPAATGRLRLRQLLRHATGLPPSMPIYAELKATKRSFHRVDCGVKYCAKPSETFSVPVAHRVHYRASERDAYYAAAKAKEPKGRLRYSDLNFFLLQQVVERVVGQTLDVYVREQFYEPLGLQLTYNPLARYGRRQTLLRTAPTEHDHKWRRQRLRGYVHDEAAALQGGVGGHAGVFGSARDLVVLFAMLAEGGCYGGVQYFQPATIEAFTQTDAGVKRALGFAKAPRPDESEADVMPVFGHTGFTGTSVWADAEAGITVAFTSNRIYRGRSNWRLQKMKVRERVLRIVYDALARDPRDGGVAAPAETGKPAL